MNPGALLTRGPLALLLGLALTSVPGPGPIPAQAQVADPPPPDTVQVDSTRLRIFQQLEELARPPGMDSIWFIPDSLLSDSALAERDARLTGRQPRQGAPRAAAGMGGRDSIMTALMEMEGYSLTEYASQGADFGAGTKQLVLLGTPEAQARLIREGEEITADSALVYSDETGKVWSVGTQAVYQPKEGDPVNSARIVFDLNQTRGTANQARTRYNAGAEWILYSDYLTVEEESAYGHEVMFTSCEEEEPHYHFAAKNIKIINDNILVARPVKLYFADVPVAWLPFIAQSTESGRASGILTPTFSINDIVRTSRRYSRRISNLGFYWAISDYMDASMSVDWWSGEHTALTGSYSYNWAR
ncbi:MAG: putative LPS assembly protein LptD, partial [Longimicrobiales bacterium]